MLYLLALLGFGLAVQSAAATLAPTGTLRAAFLETNPVQARIDRQTGAITGPVPDLVREIARRHGIPHRLMPVPDAAGVIARVRAGDADIGFLAAEAERATQVDFSEPYALMANAYLVRADSPIRSSADVDRAGTKVGAAQGQSPQKFVSEHLRQARVVVLPAVPPDAEVVKMMEAGEIDAFAANRQRMQVIARLSPGVRVLPDNFLMIGQAIAVAKGSPARLAELNRFIADVRASGFVQASLQRAGLVGPMEVPR
jgi:polar amino acid transport system substrate-binding protein